MTDILPIIYNVDLVSRMKDSELDKLIRSLSYQGLPKDQFLGSIPSIYPWIGILQLLSDLHNINELMDVQTDAELPTPIVRPVAPGGFGGGLSGVWFSTPVTGSYYIRCYINGGFRWQSDTQIDLSSNRSIPMNLVDNDSENPVQSGDILQVALVDASGTVGWWGRYSIP